MTKPQKFATMPKNLLGKPMTKTTPESFQDAFEVLKKNADYLEQSDHIDIDSLVAVVEESLVAYRVCQQRIEAVEAALKSAFADNNLSLDDGQ